MKVEIEKAIDRERRFQDSKWGVPNHPLSGWLIVLQSELDEAKMAWVKSPNDANVLREILQVIAVGVACLEQHGVVER